jgi:uncharacterized damage-inducible protein DinB
VSGRKFPDMWVDPEDDPRVGVQSLVGDGPSLGDERTTLLDYLRHYRLTLEMKCDGLDPAQLAQRSVEPSNLSLLGLVRHMAEVERAWFRRVLSGQDAPRIYSPPGEKDGDFNGASGDQACVDDAFARWRDEIAFADAFIANAPDLEVTDADREVHLREVLVHMIEEYARHCGHADLVRERIDGRTGQ